MTKTVFRVLGVVAYLIVSGAAMGQVGQVLAWGDNDYGACDIPIAAQSGVTAIAGGFLNTIVLKDGAVLGWGYGFLDGNANLSDIPTAAKSGVTAIACKNMSIACIKDGGVLVWGACGYGQCNGPSASSLGMTSIDCGIAHIVALKNDTVLAWGYNDYGQCTIPDAAKSGVSAIAAGGYHTIALKNGEVLAWGAGTTNTVQEPACGQSIVPAAAQSGVTAIAGGFFHTIALKGGEVLAWGQNRFGQCTIPLAALSGVTAIAGGGYHTIALKDGEVLAWGLSDQGQCTIPASAKSGVTAIAGGNYHTIALKDGNPNDIDGDGIPNATDNCPSVKNPTQADCDGNSVGDACELDCNHNGLADVCEILSGAVTDQNLNGIPDTCEVSGLSGVVPVSGPSTGGTAVKIIGTNFFSALPVSVTFGGAPATNVVVVSLTEIRAVTPAGTPGMCVVTVNSASSESFYYRPSCDGDLDNNGTIDSSDLGLLLINMGDCSSSLTTTQEQEPFILQSAETATPVLNKK